MLVLKTFVKAYSINILFSDYLIFNFSYQKMTDEIKLFIDDETEVDTSEEEEVVEQVRDSSSGDELMRAIREKHPEAGPSK